MNQNLYDHNQEPAVISKQLSDLILKQEHPAELMALYWFYYYTAKWQRTDQPKATNLYVAKALRWSSRRVGTIGNKLEDLGLIKKVAYWSPEKKHIVGHFVKVLFLWDTGKATLTKSNSVAKPTSNAYQNKNNINALKSASEEKDQTKFDPLDLPVHLAKFPTVVKAWGDFIESCRQIKHHMTPIAYQRIIKDMLHQSPEAIVAALDTAIVSRWRRPFFRNNDNLGMAQNGAYPQGRVRGRPDTETNLHDQDTERLLDFLTEALILRKEDDRLGGVPHIVSQMKGYYARLDKLRNPHNPDQGPTDHLPWKKFFNDWLLFLKEKQSTFPLRTVVDLKIGGTRWREFIQRCEHFTMTNFMSGKRIE